MSTIAAPQRTSTGFSPGAVLAVLSGGLAAVVAAQAMLNVGLPDLARDVGATQTQALWVVNAYSLVFAALLLPASAIGEYAGRKRSFIAGLILFGSASAASALATDPTMIIILRGLAGTGAAFVMPISLTIITATFPVERRGHAVGVWSGVSGAAGTLGLILAGCLLGLFDWTSIFYFSAAIAALGAIGAAVMVPESKDEEAPPLDLVGALLAVVGLGGIVYTIIEQPQLGWSDTGVLIALVAGVLGLVAFVIRELRTAQPMVDPRLFGHRAFGTGNLSVALQFAAAFGLFVIIFQYLHYTLGYSTLEAGLAVVPQGLGIIGAAGASDRLSRRYGLGIVGGAGLLIIAAGFAMLAVMTGVDTNYWALLPGLLVAGVGIGLASAAATTSILSGAPVHAQGSASGVNNASREVGGAIGIAAMGSLLNSTYSSHVSTTGLEPGAREEVTESISGAVRIAHGLGARGTELASNAQHASVDGFHGALWLGVAVLLLAAVVVLAVGPRPGDVAIND